MDMPDWLAGWLAGIRMGGDKDKGEYGWVDKMAGAGRLSAEINSTKITFSLFQKTFHKN